MTYRQATFYAIYLTCSHLKSSPDMRLSCRVNLFSNSRLSSKPFLFDFLTNTLSSDTQDGCVLSALLLLRFPSVIVFFMSVHCLSLCVADSWSEPVVSFCVLHVSHCGMGVWERELDAGKQLRDELTWTLVSLIVPTSEVLCVLGGFSPFLFTCSVHVLVLYYRNVPSLKDMVCPMVWLLLLV